MAMKTSDPAATQLRIDAVKVSPNECIVYPQPADSAVPREEDHMWSWPAFFEFLSAPTMLSAAWVTVWLTVVSIVGGFALGCVLTFMRTSKWKPLAAFAGFYVWIFRGTPLLVQLIIVYTGLPQVGIKLDAITRPC